MKKNSSKFTLSIIIPCYNEINTIAELIRRVKNSSIDSKEIIIIDDFSTDGTKEFLEKIPTPYKLYLFSIFFCINKELKG